MARLIRASEVGDYVFCHRAWWLRVVEGRTPDNRERLASGTLEHARHGHRVSVARLLLIVGALLLIVGIARVLLGS